MVWKEAASLILCFAGSKLESGLHSKITQELKVLMLQRTSSSSFMPDRYVFPGGLLESEDFSSNWLSRFSALKEVSVPISKNRIPLFKKYADSPVCGELGLRLCALRETFEECGILMGAKAPYHPVPMSAMTAFGPYEWNSWRLRVKNDPMEFLALFEELQLLPDVWSLHEWSNWLTPATSKKRFDTAFFIAFPSEMHATIEVEKSELSDAKMLNPREYLKMHLDKSIILAPPQIYEMSRLSMFDTVKDLEIFSKTRALEGNERMTVKVITTDDASYFLLPGDDCYGVEDLEESHNNVSKSLDINDEKVKNVNRYVVTSREGKLCCNVTKFGHVTPFPLSLSIRKFSTDSKL